MNINISRLDDGVGIEETRVMHNAKVMPQSNAPPPNEKARNQNKEKTL